MSRFNGAAPEMKNRMRPPNASRTLLNTSRSNSPLSSDIGSETARPARRRRFTSSPAENAAANSRARRPPLACWVVTMRACAFSKMRGDAPIDRADEPARQLGGHQNFAERVGHRQPQQLQIVLAEDVQPGDCRTLIRPYRMRQPHPFGPSSGSRGVD